MKEYLTIKETFELLAAQKYTTANNYILTYKDVWKGITVMNKKHPLCQWIDTEYSPKRLFVEGLFWLQEVYFAKGMTLIEADVKFFESMIEDCKKICDKENIEYSINEYVKDDMTFQELATFLDRNIYTVKKCYYKIPIEQKKNYYYLRKKRVIVKSTCDVICKSYFKKSYLQYLEQTYLQLRNIVIKNGKEIIYEL